MKNSVLVVVFLVLGFSFLLFLSSMQSAKPSRLEQSFISIAQELGLDTEKFELDLKSSEVAKTVESQNNEALKLLDNQASSPAIFIDGVRYLQNYNEIEEYLIKYSNDKSKINLTVYSDYFCSHCRAFDDILTDLELNIDLKEILVIEKKHITFLKSTSKNYAIAAEAARLQGKFPEFNKKLYELAQGKK